MTDKKTIGIILFVLTIVYIGFGDRFLPWSVGKYSYQIRNTINNYLISAFPTGPRNRARERMDQIDKELQRRENRGN